MKRTSLSNILRTACLICAAVASILQVAAVLTVYETDANYFSHGAVLPTIAAVVAVLGALCGTVSAALTDQTALNTTVFSNKKTPASAAIGFLAAALFLFVYANRTARPLIGFIAAALLLGGGVYTIFSGLPKFRQKGERVALLGFLAVLACVMLNAYYYFDVSLEMNAPFKITTQIGLLCAMVYFTGEIRFLLGKPMPRMFLALSSWVLCFGALASLSVPIAFLTGKTDRGDYAAGALLVFCSALTALTRTRTLLQAPVETADPTPTAQSEESGEV